MQPHLQITFRGMEPSTFVEARIRELALRLERFEKRITSCHVTVRLPHRHHHHGRRYDVGIRLGSPGGEIVVDRSGPNDDADEDVYVALRDAFEVVTRKLEARAGRRDRQRHDKARHDAHDPASMR